MEATYRKNEKEQFDSTSHFTLPTNENHHDMAFYIFGCSRNILLLLKEAQNIIARPGILATKKYIYLFPIVQCMSVRKVYSNLYRYEPAAKL